MYPKKSLLALSRIVKNESTYFNNTYEDPDLLAKRYNNWDDGATPSEMVNEIPRMEDHETAIRNAKVLLKHLEEKKPASPHDPILGAGFYEPGEDVDIRGLISLLQ